MEEAGAVINVGTSLFIVVLALGIAGCIALTLNALLTATSSPTGYALSSNFDNHPNANLVTIIFAILVMLHGLGYYCQYVKTPLRRCHIWLLVTGSLTVLVAAAAVLLVTRGNQIGLEPAGYYNTGLSAMQSVALTAFGVCTYKSGCFGKCNSNARLVFYVVLGIYTVWLLAYLAACAVYAVMHKEDSSRRDGGVPASQMVNQSYKRIPCVNYVLLIALTFSAYQVNFCCVPITGTDWTFLLMFGTCAGILLSVTMNYQGGGSALHNPVPYVLSALAVVLIGFLLMYSHFKEPFAQMVPGKKYTPWDLVFIVLAVVLTNFTMAFLIKWREGSDSLDDWTPYALPPVMVICTAIELVMLHFEWARGGCCGVVWQAIIVILVFEWIATLARVVIEVCGGGRHSGYVFTVSDAVYPVLVLHIVLLVAALVVCHYRMPFPGKYQLWHWTVGLWDTMLLLLVLESLVVLVVAIAGVHQQFDFGDHVGHQDNRCYVILAVHAILCGTAIGIVQFKEPLSQYWPRDQLACGVLSLVSLVSLMGVAYDGMKPKPGDSRSEPGFYCLVVYGIITFGAALFYGFRSGLVKGSCFTKKNTSSSTQLQGSDEAVSGTESIANSTEDIVTEVPLPEDNTDVM